MENNIEESIYQTIANIIYELHYKMGQPNEFDKTLRSLRVLYKQYPSFFSQDDINNINSYKESNRTFDSSDITQTIANEINELHNKMGQPNEFDKILRALRVLYKQYSSFFTQNDINNINLYKGSNCTFHTSNIKTYYMTPSGEANFNYAVEPDGTITRIGKLYEE